MTAATPFVVLGVDPADPRAVAELGPSIPADATAVYRPPGLDRWPGAAPTVRRDPPAVLFDRLRRHSGRDGNPSAVEEAIETAANGADLPVRELGVGDPAGAADRTHWWTVGAWTVLALLVALPILGLALIGVRGGLLPVLFAVLFGVAAVALLAGFVFADAAASVLRGDRAIATAALETHAVHCDERPVIVVPQRHAPGVADVLESLGAASTVRSARAGA